ncbi:MAG: hypothetical protein VX834_08020, partial [Myxococcota bacterium]|nr:hypothetical protein [Myxococcota bacterium]
PRRADAWSAQLTHTLNTLCEPPHRGYLLLRNITKILDTLGSHAKAARCDHLMSLDAMATWLKGRFDVPAGGTHNPSGAVTFCAMVPMRSIPHKVICMLGLDDQSFPRQPTTLRFDLSASPRRAGDRDLRDEDRFLFLEALLAAREHLVLLYTGSNIHTGDEEPAATPLGELADVLDQTFPPGARGKASTQLTTRHPLQAFSPSNFNAEKPWSFDGRLLHAAEAVREESDLPAPLFEPDFTLPPVGEQSVVYLSELMRFFSQPVEHLMLRRLEIDLRERVDLVSDREPINLNHLESWQLSNSMLVGANELGLDWPHLLACLRAEGQLPLGAAGDRILDSHRDVVLAGLDLTEKLRASEERSAPMSIDLDLGHTRVRGTIDSVFGPKTIHMMIGSEKGKRFISPWLSLLARTAQDPSTQPESYVVLASTKAQPVFQLALSGESTDAQSAQARATLSGLVDLYRRGMAAPLPLFEKASWAFAKGVHEYLGADDFASGIPDVSGKADKALRDATQKARLGWEGQRDQPGDRHNLHLSRVYADTCPLLIQNHAGHDTLSPLFAETALRFWGPILDARTSVEVSS